MQRGLIIKLEIALCLAVGVCVGVGFYLFDYAKGLSYFSNDPKACMNCHVMREHYDSWVKSSHHSAAKCNDCHIPHSFPQKYIEKGLNGWNHSKAFTLQNFPDPIRITPRNSKILQTNCIHCHEGMVQDVVGHVGADEDGRSCTDCHRSVGHMSLA